MATSPSTIPTSTELQGQITSLRSTFGAVVSHTTARYTELVGSDMAAALQAALNDVAQANHWHVRVSAGGLTDTHPFETPDTAVRAYRVLARTILNHMGIMVGARLANSIMREGAQQLDPAQRQLAQSHHLLPEGVLPGPAR
jgi:hypothetical protein